MKKLYLCLLAIFCSQVVDADLNEDDKAFYAISSLRYHLNCLIKNERAEKPSNDIDFRDSDISALWRKASHGPHSDQIKTIQALYSKAIRPNKSINLDTLSQASDALEALWREINSAFRENNIASAGFNTSDYSRFFLPAEHRLRKALDGIFTHAYPTKNTSSLTSAGFKIICQRASTMVVASHKELNRYLIKAYMDDERKNATRSHQWLIKRCLGAENIRNLIRTKKIKYFTVPDKWIYILPGYDQFNDGNNALLVVSRVSVVSDDESAKAWKTLITKSHLRELFYILSHGFSSTYIHGNIPYTQQGNFSCLDTEYPERLLPMHRVSSYLNDKMKIYWEHLVRTGGE